MNRRAIIVAATTLIILAIAAVSFWRPRATDKDVITIGAILPLTGEAAQWGIPPRNAALLAIEQVNAQGGVRGKKLRLVAEDDQAQAKEGVAAIQKLISSDKVAAILGPVASSVTLAVAPIADRNKVVIVSPASTSPKITEAGDFVFRVIPSDALRGQIFAEYLFKESGVRQVAILYINNEGGVGNRDSFKTRFTQLGGEVLLEEGYRQGATDLRAQITKVKSSEAQAVVVVSYPQDTVVLLRQARELGIGKPLYFQTEAVEDSNVLREAGDGAEGVVYILPAPAAGPAADAFSRAYEAKYGKKPELFAAESYDVILLLAEAIKASPDASLSPELLRDFLYATKGYKGASGAITFDRNGDVVKPMAIKRITSGTPRTIKEL